MPRTSLLLSAVGLFVIYGCSRNAARVESPGLRPGRVAAQAVERYDKNGDGRLAAEEQSPGLKALAKTADKNKDGALSEAEIAERLKAHVKSKLGLIDVGGMVLFNGRPLADATVRLVPDPVLESLIKPAAGQTNARGAVALRTEGSLIDAVQPGFYRIEVSKHDGSREIVPARYNTESELGMEVGLDVRGGLNLELKSR